MSLQLRGSSQAASVSYFNVKKYGAKGDGTTDDRVAIQNAVDAANAAGGGIVYLPAGIYLVGASVTWRTKCSLFGEGPGRSIIKSAATITASPIQVGGTSGSPLTDCVFRDFEIDGSAVPTSVQSKGIFITYLKRARFENVYIHHTTATGFGCDFLQDVVFDRCVAENCGRYAIGTEATSGGCSGFGIGTGVYQFESITVRNCVARNNARYGIFVEYQTSIGTYLSRGINIEGNHVEGNYWGIGSCGVERARIAGNLVTGSTSHGIHVGVSDATHGALSIGDQINGNVVTLNGGRGINVDASNDGGTTPPYRGGYKISDNTVRQNTSVGIKFSCSAVLSGCLVDENVVTNGSSLGVDFAGGGGFVDSAILGNLILDNTGQGIRLLAPLTRVRVGGNKVADTRASGKTQTYAVEFAATFTFTDCDVRGNDFRGNATGAINRAGTIAAATVVRDNLGDGPAVVDSLSVTASPMTYTAGAGPESLYVIGGTWTSIQINGQTVLTSAGTVEVEPYDVVTFTYTGAPIAIKRRRKSAA